MAFYYHNGVAENLHVSLKSMVNYFVTVKNGRGLLLQSNKLILNSQHMVRKNFLLKFFFAL